MKIKYESIWTDYTKEVNFEESLENTVLLGFPEEWYETGVLIMDVELTKIEGEDNKYEAEFRNDFDEDDVPDEEDLYVRCTIEILEGDDEMIEIKYIDAFFYNGVDTETIQTILDNGRQGFSHLIAGRENGFILASGDIGYEMTEEEADSIMALLEHDSDEELAEEGIYVLQNGLKAKLMFLEEDE